MAKAKPKAPAKVRTQKAAAAALGVDERQLRRWLKEGWFPPNGKTSAGFDIEVIRQARDAMGRKGSEQSTAQQKLKLATDNEKFKQAQIVTREKQLALREREGELVPRRAVELHFATLLTGLADWSDQLPDLIAGEFPAKLQKKLKQRLKQELDRKRQELRGELERQAREMETAPDDG